MFRNLCLVCICFVLVSSTTLSATEIDVPALQKKIYSTIEDVTPAVVSISLRGRRQLGGFSGVIVSKDGHVLQLDTQYDLAENMRSCFPTAAASMRLAKVQTG